MKLLVAADAHLFVLKDGSYWCDSVETYDFWKRYLNVFDSIRVVTRVKPVDFIDSHYRRADGPNVEIWEIPFFQGPKQLLRRYWSIRRAFGGCFQSCDCALFRVPSQTAYMALSELPKGLPFAGEVVYCQRDSLVGLKPGVMKMLYLILSHRLEHFCLRANGVSYVTEKAIQRYYPNQAMLHGESNEFFSSYYSSIVLNPEYFAGPRCFDGMKKITLSISDAAMDSERKGERIVIKVVNRLRSKGLDVSAIIIGDGSKRSEYEQLVESLGISAYINFVGQQPAEEVRRCLLNSDIYILPTQGEGLPRGILEAMALGLPVLSTPVGGIAEVVEAKYLFNPLDVDGFTCAIENLYRNVDQLEVVSKRNFEKALEYQSGVLQGRRDAFYMKLKKLALARKEKTR